MRRMLRPIAFVSVGAVVLVGVLYFTGVLEIGPRLPPIPDVNITTSDPTVQNQLRQARRDVDEQPRHPVANGKLGVLYELYLYPEPARMCYARASLLAPREFRWKYYLGRIERALGDPEAAIGTLGEALAIDGQYVPAIAQLGEAHLDQGRAAEAEETFRTALRHDPRSCAALVGLGRALAEQGDHAGAIEQYERALDVAPQHAPLHYALGMSYRAVGDTVRAQRHLEIALGGRHANPDFDPYAAQMYELDIGPEGDYRKAMGLLNAREYDVGIVLLRRVVARRPDHVGAHGALAKALSLVGRPDEALAEYEAALALNPSNVDFLRPCALLLYQAGRYEEAEARLRKVLQLGGDHHDDHHVLGGVLAKLERPDEAIEAFERALELRPDHTEARRGLIQMLKLKANLTPAATEVIPYLERILELEPGNVQTLKNLGRKLQETGDLDGALARYDQALLLNPSLLEVVRWRDELRARIEAGEGD